MYSLNKDKNEVEMCHTASTENQRYWSETKKNDIQLPMTTNPPESFRKLETMLESSSAVLQSLTSHVKSLKDLLQSLTTDIKRSRHRPHSRNGSLQMLPSKATALKSTEDLKNAELLSSGRKMGGNLNKKWGKFFPMQFMQASQARTCI